MTTLELNEEEANLFILFCKYREQVAYLISQGFFEIKGGNVTIHFNSNGDIMYGEVSRSWQRRRKLDKKNKNPMIKSSTP